MVTCLGTHTLTGVLNASGQQFSDWSAAYRLFERERMDVGALFAPLRQAAIELMPAHGPIVACMDDTVVRKRGRHVTGASWRRDPLGPAFQTNLVWAQRYLQIALIVPEAAGPARGRAIPIRFEHCPSPKRPPKDATPEDLKVYKEQVRERRLPAVGSSRLRELRTELDEADEKRHLIMAVDGGYTNITLFKNIPPNTTVVGRVRKDAKLYHRPPANELGRPRVYGADLPTPEQIRQDEAIPWQEVIAYAAGRKHTFNVKTVGPVRWRGAGPKDLRLVVIRPLGYRPRAGSKLLYRAPAYLLCSDPDLNIQQLVQAYVWRWEAEVAFHDQKSVLGQGEAQVRKEPAVTALPAFVTAVYSMLHLAALRCEAKSDWLPGPRWQRKPPEARCSTGQLISLVRVELWGKALGISYSDFRDPKHTALNWQKRLTPAAGATIYAQK